MSVSRNHITCNCLPDQGTTEPAPLKTAIKIEAIDHLVLTVSDIDTSRRFYCNVPGMQAEQFSGDRWAVKFGRQKINLHPSVNSLSPTAKFPAPGATDLCLLTATPLAEVIATLVSHDVSIIDGPLPRTGATGTLESVYIHDPDGNLIEISNAILNN